MKILARSAFAALALIAAASGPALAKPGDAACLWALTPQAARDTVTRKWPDGFPGTSNAFFDDPAVVAVLADKTALAACGLEKLSGDELHFGLFSQVILNGSLSQMARNGVGRGNLEAAWAALPQADRDLFARITRSEASEAEKAEGPRIVADGARTAAIKDARVTSMVATFFAAKVMNEDFDAKY